MNNQNTGTRRLQLATLDEPTKYLYEATKLGNPMDEPTKYRHKATKLEGLMDEQKKNTGTGRLN